MKRVPLAAAVSAAIAFGTLAGCSKPGTPDQATVSRTPFDAQAADDKSYAPLAKLPDWSGVWEPMRFARPGKAEAPPAPPKLTAKYAGQYSAYQEKNKSTPGINFVSQVANCVPPGLPGSMQQPYPIEFLFTPGRVTVLIETYSLIRRIYTDGAAAPTDPPDPSYQGTSTGKWDGDTLVVETTSILPETSPLNGINGHSDKLKITERIRLAEPDVLEIVTTREDPDVFVEPYTTTAHYQRHRDWKIMEYVCSQNNHDFVDDKGNPGFSLDRKPGE